MNISDLNLSGETLIVVLVILAAVFLVGKILNKMKFAIVAVIVLVAFGAISTDTAFGILDSAVNAVASGVEGLKSVL